MNLGDIVSVPPRGPLSLRAVAAAPERSASFAVLGECDSAMLVHGSSTWMLLPASPMPDAVRWGVPLAEGSRASWAPHLPAAAGAMGYLLWRLVRPAGSVTLSLIAWRGPDRMVFVPVYEVSPGSIAVTRMPWSQQAQAAQAPRASAVPAPAPARLPVPASLDGHSRMPEPALLRAGSSLAGA